MYATLANSTIFFIRQCNFFSPVTNWRSVSVTPAMLNKKHLPRALHISVLHSICPFILTFEVIYLYTDEKDKTAYSSTPLHVYIQQDTGQTGVDH